MDSNQQMQQQASYQPMHAAPEPPKKKSNAPLIVVAILAIVVIAVAAFVIFSQNSGGDQNQQGAEKPQATDNPQGAATAADPNHVETADFEFDIPEYYQDKVEWSAEEVDGSDQMVTVYRKGHPDQALFWVWSTTSSEDVEMEGDVGTHVVDYVESDGKYIAVSSTNWAYMTAYYVTQDVDASYTEEDLRALVDLSTGGRYTFEQVIKMGPEEVGVPDIDFCEKNVVSTLKTK